MKRYIILHHTANSSNERQAEQVICYHRRKFGQAGAYQWFIEPDALVIQFHDENFNGCHAGSYFYNTYGIGICLAGDFTKEQPTTEQVDALTKLVSEIQSRWGIPDENILLHREIRNTTCPGTDLRALLFHARLRLLANKISRLERAEERATGTRKLHISRLLNRLLKLLPDDTLGD